MSFGWVVLSPPDGKIYICCPPRCSSAFVVRRSCKFVVAKTLQVTPPRSSSISAPSIACSSGVGASIAAAAVFVINLGFIHRLQLRCSIKFLYEPFIMLRPFLSRATQWKKPLFSLNHQRGIHSRNKKAMELVAKGWSALQEVDRVIDYTELNDPRLIPLLRGAKENFELALEIDNLNTHARYWLGRMHFKYHVPGACKLVGAALLVEAANMGDADAQYELGCRLRVENDYVQSDQQAFYYLEKAVDQLHPGALYLLGSVYLTGDCVKKDVASALWCFHRASEKGHPGAAIAYGSLLLQGVEVPEVLTRFASNKSPSAGGAKKKGGNYGVDPLKRAREQFQIAANAGCDLGLQWLKRLDNNEKLLLAEAK